MSTKTPKIWPVESSLENLGCSVRQVLLDKRRSEEEVARCDECVAELDALVHQQLGNGWQVQAFGSLANGFCTATSDLDVTCVFNCKGENDKRSAAHLLGWNLRSVLQSNPRFEVVEQVLSARVPILKLRFDGLLDVDLSAHNTQPLFNTRLLKTYCQLDPSIRDLGVAVKLWSKAADVVGASKFNLSSYAINLLVVYFLQVDPKVQLPLLPTNAFGSGALCDADPRVISVQMSWKCPLSLPQLIFRFFSFYAEEFVWGSEVVAVRLGRRLFSNEPTFRDLPGRWNSRINIEDPFETNRNLHCVLEAANEANLHAALVEALNRLKWGLVPVGMQLDSQPSSPLTRPRFASAIPVATEAANGALTCEPKPDQQKVAHKLLVEPKPSKAVSSRSAQKPAEKVPSESVTRIPAVAAFAAKHPNHIHDQLQWTSSASTLPGCSGESAISGASGDSSGSSGPETWGPRVGKRGAHDSVMLETTRNQSEINQQAPRPQIRAPRVISGGLAEVLAEQRANTDNPGNSAPGAYSIGSDIKLNELQVSAPPPQSVPWPMAFTRTNHSKTDPGLMLGQRIRL